MALRFNWDPEYRPISHIYLVPACQETLETPHANLNFSFKRLPRHHMPFCMVVHIPLLSLYVDKTTNLMFSSFLLFFSPHFPEKYIERKTI